jgi:glycosyltransferase involved in cell wall biosynthesis
MRILVLTFEFPPVGGGGGRAACDICEKLAARGHQVLVLTSHMKGLPKSETLAGIQVVRIPSLRRKAFMASIVDMAAYIVSAVWNGMRIVPGWKPDVLQVHFAVPTGPAGWILSRLYHIPYVLTAHLGDVPGGVPEKTTEWFRWILPFTYPIWRDAAQVVAVSEFTRELALRYYSVNIKVIPNGVDTHVLDPGEIILRDPPQIIFAARFMLQKNPLQIVRVLADLRDLPWKCKMLGDGPLLQQVREQIAKVGLLDRFELPGWVNPEQVLAHYAQSDILFMPSLSEGFPLTGVQALAMGLAIVASRVSGFVDLVHNGENGYLYNPADTQGMQNGLRALLTDPQLLLKMRQNSRLISKDFDLKNIVEQYEGIFRQVVSRPETGAAHSTDAAAE